MRGLAPSFPASGPPALWTSPFRVRPTEPHRERGQAGTKEPVLDSDPSHTFHPDPQDSPERTDGRFLQVEPRSAWSLTEGSRRGSSPRQPSASVSQTRTPIKDPIEQIHHAFVFRLSRHVYPDHLL